MKALPNIISVFRICLVPIFAAAFVLEQGSPVKFYTIGIFIIANASDILDGYIARKYNAQTNLGKILDPLGDKLIIFTALVCIASQHQMLIWAPCIYFVKEILMGIGGYLIDKKEQVEIPSSNWLGKSATVTFFLVCLALLAAGQFIPGAIAVIIMILAMCHALAAFINYLHTFIKLMKTPSAENTEET